MKSIQRHTMMWVLLCSALELWAWQQGWRLPGHSSMAHMLGVAEMVCMTGLLCQSWRLMIHVRAHTSHWPMAQVLAKGCLLALLLCVGGDLVNRNFPEAYFAYDRVIEHSYLADSVWFFLPGYALWIGLAWYATRHLTGTGMRLLTLGLTGAAGVATFFKLLPPGTSAYIAWTTGVYSPVITSMVAAGLWLVLAYGKRMAWVALGAVLAAVADALIAQFWLYGQGHYPAIAHVNFIVYVISQALMLQLPLKWIPTD